MVKKINNINNINYYYFLLLLLIIVILVYIYRNYNYNFFKNNDKICMSISQYNNLLNNNNNNNNYNQSIEKKQTINNQERDYRVLEDQLYPPLNRSDINTQDKLKDNIEKRNMYINTNNYEDKYRLVGYLINKDNDKDVGGNNWKLFARQKDRHSSEFYMIPANNNYDVKIFIKDDIIVGERLRDIYAIPNVVSFNSPMLGTNPYEFVEIPKADLSASTEYL